MFQVMRLKNVGICITGLFLFGGFVACNDAIVVESSSSVIEVQAESSAAVRNPLLAKISPPEVLLPGGKDHFNKRLPEIAAQPILNGGILLAGDSITEAWLWHEDYLPLPASNHGIGWDIAEGLKLRLPLILQHNPDHLFILIGTNDIGYGHDAEVVAPHVEAFVQAVKKEKPKTKLYLQAVLPREMASMPKVSEYNAVYKSLAKKQDIIFIDMTAEFEAADGTLNPDYSDDGLHLNAAGYALWGDIIKDKLVP
jgi:lysophospholipase L1-like esterase